MPPSRRRPTPNQGQPPTRRPRVAGLRNRPPHDRQPRPTDLPEPTPDPPAPVEPAPTSQDPTPNEPPTEQTPTEKSATEKSATEKSATEKSATEKSATEKPAAREPAPDELATEEPGTEEPATEESSAQEPAPDDRDVREPAVKASGTEASATEEPADEPEAGEPEAEEPGAEERAGGARPVGKRRATGSARPADLTAAEAEAGGRPVQARPTRLARPVNRYAVAAVLTVVAAVLAGLAIWFRGEADALESRDTNTALTDVATTSAVLSQLTTAIEDTFSYNYTDLDSTQRAVDRVLADSARCEYDQLFGQVQELAPKQKVVMTTIVRSIGLVRLDGDRAEALVFIDQSSTRVDINKSVAGEAQLGVLARREGDTWKITDFNMFDQTLLDGTPIPGC